MTREEFKQAVKKSGITSPWRAMFLEYGRDTEVYVADLAEVLEKSAMTEVEKLYFIEKWFKASEVGRINLEKALLMDVERLLSSKEKSSQKI